jgi:hypothetical protein
MMKCFKVRYHGNIQKKCKDDIETCDSNKSAPLPLFDFRSPHRIPLNHHQNSNSEKDHVSRSFHLELPSFHFLGPPKSSTASSIITTTPPSPTKTTSKPKNRRKLILSKMPTFTEINTHNPFDFTSLQPAPPQNGEGYQLLGIDEEYFSQMVDINNSRLSTSSRCGDSSVRLNMCDEGYKDFEGHLEPIEG